MPGWLSGDSTCLVSRRSNPPWVRVPHPAPQPRAVAERSKASVCKTDGASPRRFESAPHVHFPQGFKSLLLLNPVLKEIMMQHEYVRSFLDTSRQYLLSHR